MAKQTNSLFQLDEFKPYAADWHQRQKMLAYRKAYADGTIYASVRRRFQALGRLSPMLGPRLYRGTKALFLMLSRAIHVDAGIIPGGWALPEATAGRYDTAIKQVFAWSDWARDGVLYVHHGAQYGLSGLKVMDIPDARRVQIAPLDPTTFMLVPRGTYDRTPRMAIIVEQRRNGAGELYQYAEVITPDMIRTFADGEPMGIDGRDPEYTNNLGRVPVVEVLHMHTGDPLGQSTAEDVFPLLDEVNELASYLGDIIRKHAEAQWAVIGAEGSDLTKSGDNVWFVPQGGDVKALVAGIDIPGVLAFIQAIRDEVHGGLPELAFDELKHKANIATATLELQLMELVLKIKRTRPNYDHGLADALRMAGAAAVGMGLPAIAVLNDEALAFDENRPVLPLDRITELTIQQMELNLQQQEAIAGQGEATRLLPPPTDAPATDEVPTDA
jgi:hypothetical protein